MSARAPAPPQAPHGSPAWLRWLAGTGLVLLALVVALAAALAWLRTPAGLGWVVDHVPGLTLGGLQGRPDGGPFSVARLQWRSATLTVTVKQLSWQDLAWRWRPHAGAWLGFTLIGPRAQSVTVQTRPADPATSTSTAGSPPDHLALPIDLTVKGLRVGALRVDTLPEIDALAADIALGAEGGSRHRVSRLEARMAQWQVQAQLAVGTRGELPLSGEIALTRSAAPPVPPVSAHLTLGGHVARPRLQAQVDAGTAGRLAGDATLAPFAAWPLLALQLEAQGLDLAALGDALPVTELSGTARLTGGAEPTQALTATLALTNAQPGPWGTQRLPLRRLAAEIASQPADRNRLDLRRLALDLQGTHAAGRVTGQGAWTGHALDLDLRLDEVDAAQLDPAVAAPMTLSGPLQLQVKGLPAPDPSATPAAPAARGPGDGVSATVQAELHGRTRRGSATPVRLAFEGGIVLPPDGSLRADPLHATLDAGQARAEAQGSVQRDTQGTWQGRTRGQLSRFDPAVWWAGARDAPGWRRGPHVLNGSWEASFQLPPAATPVSPTAASAPVASAPAPSASPPAPALRQRLLAIVADARLSLHDSRLAGVPLKADLTVKADGRRAQVQAELHVASAEATGQLAIGPQPAGDRAELRLDAPALAPLAPLFDMLPGADAWAPRSGSLHADGTATGAWPAIRTEGQLSAQGIDGGGWRLGRAQAQWAAATREPTAPLRLSLELSQLAHGEQRIDTASAELRGSLHEHRLNLLVSSPLRPPAWTDAALSQGQAPPRGGRLVLRGSGQWRPDATGGGRWQGRVDELRAAPAPDGSTPWVQAHDLQPRVRFGDAGGLAEASLAPGSIELLGATLAWQQARYAAPGSAAAPPQLEVDARLEPLLVAPWLARLQPHMGWRGDLRIGGHLQARSGGSGDAGTAGLTADLLIERRGGDLQLSGAAGSHTLGLSDLRVAATAQRGTWQIDELLRGSGLGEVKGRQRLGTAAQAMLPDAQSSLQGSLALNVADLAAWSAWLPAGWRVGGQLSADATLGGRLGAPDYRGRLTGSGLRVANLLQGVQLTDGELVLALHGQQATLERLRFRGGEGELLAHGSAQLGAAPVAQLQVQARHLLALGRIDRRVVLSGQAALNMNADDIRLRGRFSVDQGRIDISQADAPSLDEDVTVVQVHGKGPAVASDADSSPGALAGAKVQLALDLGQDLRLRGRGLDTLLKGRLQITTPDGELAINGTLRTDEGTYTAYGQNLAIERGIIRFNGEIATPRLDILAVRPDIDVRVGVVVQGSAADPRVRLYSEPEMSEMDKLSWLVMGRAPEGMGREDTALLQRAALALLAGERGNPSGGFLQKLGLDELSVARGDSGELRDTVVTLGKQLSKRWFVAYERGLNAAVGSWQLIYRVARRFTVRAESGDESALDVIWTWRWNGRKASDSPAPTAGAAARPGGPPKR
ncbi:MAG: translocation/assembly module TamB domain-containing protein [Rhizobacter sp.]|nr:translocation/assembly module TamB domain-containing protein [Rhizobacter sp.]